MESLSLGQALAGLTAEGRSGKDVVENRKIQVLLVEDEDSHAELVRRAFQPRSATMRLAEATTLAEARRQLCDDPPDLLLADLVLPDGKSTELLPGEEDAAELPVVIMTSHGDEAVAVEAMKAGALDYVVKSPATLADMPHIAEGALREWGHILERRRAERALKTSEEYFRSLIENALDVITVLHEDLTIQYASPSIERVLGWGSESVLGINMLDFVEPDVRERVEAELVAALAEPGATRVLEYSLRHRQGTPRILEAIIASRIEPDGERRLVINSRDITDRRQEEEARRRLEDQLRSSQRWEIIGTLTGDITNEFNNLLTPIIGYAEMALMDLPPASSIRPGIERILQAANRSRDLAEQLFMFGRRAEPQRRRVQLEAILNEVLKLVRATLPVNIEIRQSKKGPCDDVMVDPSQIHQVIMNLCTNAQHAMRHRGGVLEIGLEMAPLAAELEGRHLRPSAEDWVRLTVRDTGHGMQREIRERALEPFFTTKGKGESTGLGLAVTHGIIVSHGGELVIDSVPNEGTMVHVFLPPAASPQEPSLAPANSVPSSSE